MATNLRFLAKRNPPKCCSSSKDETSTAIHNGIYITSFAGIGDFFPKENSSNEVSPEKPGLSVANEHPGTSSEEQGIEGIEEIVED